MTLAADSSLKPADRAHLKCYLQKWKQPNILVGCTLYIDALNPVSLLSITLQHNDADIVSSIESTIKSAKALQLLAAKVNQGGRF